MIDVFDEKQMSTWVLILSIMAGFAAHWSGYNPFLWFIVTFLASIVSFAAADAMVH